MNNPRSLLLLGAFVASTSLLPAQTTWIGATNDFNTAGNWSTGLPSASSAANFSGSNPQTVNATAPISVLGLNFAAAGYGLSGSTLTVGTNGIDAAASLGTITIGNQINFTSASTGNDIGAGTTVDITGQLNLSGATAIYEKSGEGTLTLSGAGAGSAFNTTANNPATGTKILVSNGVLNLNKTISTTVNGGNPYYVATSGDAVVNVQQLNQFGSPASFRPAFRLAGSSAINIAASLGSTSAATLAGASGAYALSFGTDVDGNASAGGGTVSVGGGSVLTVEDIRYQGTTAAAITGSGTTTFRAGERVINVADGANTYKELTFGTLLVTNNASNFTKTGDGTLVITANNSNSALNKNLFQVNQGKLLVNNTAGSAVGSTGVTVAAGATLGGTGRIAPGLDDSVTFAAGGILAPGDINEVTGATEVESLDFAFAGTGQLDLSLGALYQFDLGANTTAGLTYDTINVTGIANFGTGTLDFADFAFNQLSGFGVGNYTLFSATTLQGTIFTASGALANGYTGTLSIVGNSLNLNVVPEPSTWALLGFGLMGLMVFRKRRAA